MNAGTRLGTVTTGADGRAVSDLDFPLMSETYLTETDSENSGATLSDSVILNSGDYYLKELSVPGSYYLNETEYPVHLEYKDQETKVIATDVEAVNTQTSTVISKTSIANSEELPGCELQITDAEGNVTAILDEKGAVQVNGLLHDTDYTLTETRPADGFVTADSISFSLSRERTVRHRQPS